MLHSFYQQLYKKPVIGCISGLMSGVFVHIRTMLTDEATLKMIAGLGVWMATIVSILSAIIYTFKVWDALKMRLKRWNESRRNKAIMLFLVISGLLCCSCRSRKVDLVKTSSVITTDLVNSTRTEKSDSSRSFNFERFRDSVTAEDAYRIDITPDTGAIISFSNGVFTGKAKSVTVTGKRKATGTKNSELSSVLVQQSTVNTTDSSHLESKATTVVKEKHTEAKSSGSWVLIVLGVLVCVFVFAYAYHWFKNFKAKI